MVDYKVLGERIMGILSDKTLEPRSHFRILPNRYREEEIEKIWEPGIEKNEIGFILEDFNKTNEKYITEIEFYVRIGASEFAFITIEIEKSCKDKSRGRIRYNLSYPDTKVFMEEVEFPEISLDLEIPIRLVKGAKDLENPHISLRVIKNIKETENGNKILFKLINNTPNQRFKVGRKTFEFGHFLEYKLKESSSNPIITNITKIKGYGLLPQIEATKDNIQLDSVEFLDYYIGEINVFSMKSSNKKISEFSKELEKKIGDSLQEELINYFKELFESKGYTLYSFQQKSIEAIIREINNNRKPVVITARTAAGKTEAFIFPILSHILKIKKKFGNPKGVKAFLLYPTKALANDQFQRLLEILYFLNQHSKYKITVGVYHGDIEEKLAFKIPLPLRCIKHEKERNERKVKLKEIRLKPENGFLVCPKCKEKYDFLLVDRFKVVTEMPDIIISTPDMLNRILIERPYNHNIFGAKITSKFCPECKKFYSKEYTRCLKCEKDLKEIKLEPEYFPEIIILDELHLFNSLFGGNISYLLKRIEYAIKFYSNKDVNIQFIGASATIKNPKEFASDLFRRSAEDIVIVKADRNDFDISKKTTKVVIFASPTAYRMIDTVGYLTVRAFGISNFKLLVFTNTLSTCDMLLSNIKHRFSTDPDFQELLNKIDGHNSQYTKQKRAEIEERFDEGDIRVLISTSTLEVGVDFRDIDCLILYSAPYSFNSYLQRIGRAGRKEDAIIINILNPSDPIDIFYYRKALEIINDPSEFIEYPPFPESNRRILHKQIISSIFDVCNFKGINVEYAFSNLHEIIKLLPELLDLWNKGDIEECVENIEEKYSYLEEQELIEKVKKDFKIFDLRKAEENIEVEFESFSPLNLKKNWKRKEYRKYKLSGLDRKDINIIRKIKSKRWKK